MLCVAHIEQFDSQDGVSEPKRSLTGIKFEEVCFRESVAHIQGDDFLFYQVVFFLAKSVLNTSLAQGKRNFLLRSLRHVGQVSIQDVEVTF